MPYTAQLAGIQKSIGRMEGTLGTHITSNLQRVAAIEEDADRLEKRVRSVEHWRGYLGGAIAFGAALLGFAFIA